MGRGLPVLKTVDVQRGALAEFDLAPTQVAKLRSPQPMPEGDQDHRGVAVAVAVRPGRFNQPLNLRLGEMFARPIFGVRTAKQMNCAFFVAWRDQLQCWFCHEKIPRSQQSTVHITCLMRSVGRSAIEQSLEAV